MTDHAFNSAVQFPLDRSVGIPRRLAEYKRGDRTLFVATEKAAYVNVGSMGSYFVHMFEDGLTIREAISSAKDHFGNANDDEIHSALKNLLTQIETRQFYQSAKVTDDSFDQLSMLIRLTNRCNLRCSHCLVSSAPDWPTNNDMSSEMICSVLDHYAAFVDEKGFTNPRVTLTGGEALSRRDAIDIGRHSRSLGIYTELYTNGTLIVNSSMASNISSAFDEVQVSLDGATANAHDSIRGVGMFGRAIRGIRLLREAGVKFRIAVVVMPQNFDDLLSNLPNLFLELGGGFSIRLSLVIEEGRANASMKFPTIAEGERRLKIMLDHLSAKEARRLPIIIPNMKTQSCGYARELTINSDGLVYGCGPQQFSIGDLRKESFLSIASRTVHKSKMAEVDHIEGCRDCNIRYLCGGTCRINNMSRVGKPNVTDCDLANKEYNLMKLFGYSSEIVPLAALTSNTTRRSI
jgi:radical SAM protein with 4Fe4S-binding SPASM domain